MRLSGIVSRNEGDEYGWRIGDQHPASPERGALPLAVEIDREQGSVETDLPNFVKKSVRAAPGNEFPACSRAYSRHCLRLMQLRLWVSSLNDPITQMA